MIFQSISTNLYKYFETALIIAVKENKAEVIKLLIEQPRIDINAKNIY